MGIAEIYKTLKNFRGSYTLYIYATSEGKKKLIEGRWGELRSITLSNEADSMLLGVTSGQTSDDTVFFITKTPPSGPRLPHILQSLLVFNEEFPQGEIIFSHSHSQKLTTISSQV